jgi:hypothetical protein
MRSSLKLGVAVFATAATMFGGSAFASGHGGGTQTPQTCGTGTVSTDAPVTLWPPNGKSHTYTFTYSGGTSGDVLTTTTTSSDGNGVVSDSAPGTADDSGTATTTDTVRSQRPGTSKTGRTYTVSYTVSGSNTCDGSFTITVPHDRRKAK